MPSRSQKVKEEQKDESDIQKTKAEREIEVQKAIDQTLIREIEYLLAFLAFIFVAYLIHVINLVRKAPN